MKTSLQIGSLVFVMGLSFGAARLNAQAALDELEATLDAPVAPAAPLPLPEPPRPLDRAAAAKAPGVMGVTVDERQTSTGGVVVL
ncbi:MAG: hypothetical protein KDA41_22485, partial [Planctomycetales bacterium]|nr:hypothetical protein [Planctomycetales bacterium]